MKITSITVFSGPSRYCVRPILRARFDIAELQHATRLPKRGALEKILSELIPGFSKIVASTQKNEPKNTSAGLIPIIALALQNLLGCQLSFQQSSPITSPDSSPGCFEIVFEYESSNTARLATTLSLKILFAVLQHRFAASLPKTLQVPENFDIKQQIDHFVKIAEQYSLDDSTRDIIRALEEQNIPWHRLNETSRIIQAGYGIHRKFLVETITSQTAVPSNIISRDKSLTNTLLQRTRFPVPRQAVATSLKQVIHCAQSIGYPIVMKPAMGSKGRGITIGIQNETELQSALTRAQQISKRVIIESFIAGDDYRFLVVGKTVVTVAKRVPGHVVGDGHSTVQELVTSLNSRPDRGQGYGRHYVEIELNQLAQDCLREQGLTLNSVPEPERVVPLRRTANMSTGGTSIDMTDQAHPDNIAMAERVAAVTGLDIVGVDFISTDISRSYLENGGGICEINVGPGLRPHWFAEGGETRDVAAAIVEHLFSKNESKNGVVLSAAITGTNGKTTTCRMVDAILRQSGLFTGMTNSDGVYINEQLIQKRDSAGIGGARAILADSRLEAAVLETARGGILKFGIGFSACTVCAVLNITPDHLGYDGVETLEEMAGIKQLVAELAQEAIVLNADDPLCIDMIANLGGRKLSLVTRDPDNCAVMIPIANVENLVTLAPGKSGDVQNIVLRAHGKETMVLRTLDIPATFNGLARHNVDNAMFAVAITHSMGIELDSIRTALRKFTCDFKNTPGRTNILYDESFTVMLDYGHNPEGIRAIGELVEDMDIEGKLVCVLSSPSNREPDHFIAIAEAAAESFDHIICSNWYDLRNRPAEFVPDALSDALITCGFDKDEITVCSDPDDSIKNALQNLAEDNFLVIFGDQAERRRKLTLETLNVIPADE